MDRNIYSFVALATDCTVKVNDLFSVNKSQSLIFQSDLSDFIRFSMTIYGHASMQNLFISSVIENQVRRNNNK